MMRQFFSICYLYFTFLFVETPSVLVNQFTVESFIYYLMQYFKNVYTFFRTFYTVCCYIKNGGDYL